MSRYVFVPLTDELLYEHPDLISGPIRPYIPGEPCHHWLSVEINPQDDVPPATPRPASGLIPTGLPTLEKAVRGEAHSL